MFQKLALLITILVIVFSLLSSLTTPQYNIPTQIKIEPTRTPNPLRITYKIYIPGKNGSRADVTYSNETGGTNQIDDILIPWDKSFIAVPGQFLYVSGQNLSDRMSHKTIVCEIRVNGVIVAQSMAEGEFGIASCSGTARDTKE